MNATALAQQVKSVFSLPEIVLQVNEILDQPEPKIAALEEIIIHDPGLTASILKLVNSSYYSFPGKIDTLSKAIVIIGLRELKSLVIGSSVTSQFKGIEPHLVDMNVFWYHSVTRGVLAKKLARACKRNNTERFFIAGLLSSIGKLVLFSQYPQQSAEIVQMGVLGDAESAQAERQRFGFDYAELSAELLKEWKLPAEICEMIAYQLKPLDSPNQQIDACILHIASAVANNIQPCANYDFNTLPLTTNLSPDVLSCLQLEQSDIESISFDASLQAMDIIGIIRPEVMAIF